MWFRTRAAIGWFAIGALSLMGGGCARSGLQPASTTGRPTGSIVVFAAASLTEAFEDMKAAFQREHPGASVIYNFAASSALATQIIEQAGADLFASADESNMQKVADMLDQPATRFGRNRLEIVVERGNPKGIEGLAGLGRADVKVVLAAPQVPVGRYAREALAKAGVSVKPVSLESDVKAVVSKVALGEADAGIAYHTDLIEGDRTAGVAIPEAQNVLASYPIAVVKEAKNSALARAFVRFVLSKAGQAIMIRHGFVAP